MELLIRKMRNMKVPQGDSQSKGQLGNLCCVGWNPGWHSTDDHVSIPDGFHFIYIMIINGQVKYPGMNRIIANTVCIVRSISREFCNQESEFI